ncbi:helix-turn-helix domain-containing protein [Labrys wisconsinensis]|uniref:AraC-like DNA-binding protein n=1 Tax=Labrys wisconsinensis TaxID=425677 RepID=A0ABU0J3I2_9HYPH|nr:AraC family transcriptional regulator [Labrys wisconsinensis]MDQ0468091.1 AraC-like DNA-binding protein [Labrys wisconsinensis]
MSFKPRMTSKLEGIRVVEDLKWRAWNGVVADVWHAACGAGARGDYVSRDARLFVVLEKQGGHSDLRLSPLGADLPACRAPQHLSFVPADMPLWSRIDEAMRVRHLDLHFDAAALGERLGEALDPARLATPRLRFVDERLLGLARLIAAECVEPSHHELYGDGLTVALFVDLMRLGRDRPRRRTALAGWQLRRAIAFIEDNCLRNIRLQELADLTELSQSYFSHAFKAATGLPPHQWHMQARIRRVQAMLANAELALTDIAAAAGFADQAHLTRVFRGVTGQTPAAWRRARLD